MKFKKLLILTGIVLALLILVVIKNSLQKKRDILERMTEPEIALVNGSINVSASKIIIYKGDDEKNKVILSRQNDEQWVLESKFGLRVKKEATDNLLNSLKDLKGELRADSKSVFGDFQIQDNQTAHLILSTAGNQPLTHLVVSFKSPNWKQNFVRVFNSDKIVLVDRNILFAIGLFDKTVKLDENYFADYRISPFDANSVNKIELMAGKKRSLALIKIAASDKNPGSVWNFEPADKKSLPDLAKVNEYLQNVTGLYAQDILDPALKSYGFERPVKVLKLSLLKDNQPEQIQIEVGAFIKDKKAYYIRVMPQNQVFVVLEPSISNLIRDKSYFTVKANKTKKK
ncbi:MAG: DUF4340 domain-containing protein [Candidatus Omnitrophica bacterium]|nr:DUF4340 domain-containing protein [Candidatus Omnitrophota bacterium]